MIDSPLLKPCLGYINGRWVGAVSEQTSSVRNPATGEHLADVPKMGETETSEAIEAAAGTMHPFASASDRQKWLLSIAAGLLDHRDALGKIITMEQGKPLREAAGEVEYAAAFYSHFAGILDHVAPRALPERLRNCRWTVHHRPAGVAGLITPWNFPLAMFSKKLSAAMGAGCAVVMRPASPTPLSAVAFCHVAERVGIPPGWINLVIGDSKAIARVLCEHPAVRVISFTGSTEIGQTLAGQASPRIKRVAMELGGNAPFIVFEDADLPQAVEALVANKFRCGGQTCVCANRVFVHQSVIGAFIERLAPRVEALKVGDGLAPDTNIGPLINRSAFDKVAGHVADALSKGARRIVGTAPLRPPDDWGCFYPPTLLSNITRDMRVFQEETFGPIIALTQFSSENEAIRLANDTEYGLAAYVFTADSEKAHRCAECLSFGHVGINTGTGPTPEAPFGGMKHSGFGREGGTEGLAEFCEPQTVVMG